jgi:hypothetical protein
MAGELSAIEHHGAAIKWALGCLSVAIDWRIRADLTYFLALVVSRLTVPNLSGYLLLTYHLQQFEPYLALGGMISPLSARLGRQHPSTGSCRSNQHPGDG